MVPWYTYHVTLPRQEASINLTTPFLIRVNYIPVFYLMDIQIGLLQNYSPCLVPI